MSDWDFFTAEVRHTRWVTPNTVRISFGGAALDRLDWGGRDQRIKLFLPRPGQREPVAPLDAGDQWWPAYRQLDPDVRAVMRTYTMSGLDADGFDIDFALHGDVGPATRWARRARPGSRVAILGPTSADNYGVDFRPPAGTDWVLVAADDTAIPAACGILAWLPETATGEVYLEVGDPADVRTLPTRADVRVHWLVRSRGETLAQAVPRAVLPDGVPYAFLAGESSVTVGLRRHLVGERQIPRERIVFTGYWRRGASEEDLMDEVPAE